MQYQLELTRLTLLELLELQKHIEKGVIVLDEKNRQKLDEYVQKRAESVTLLASQLQIKPD